MDRRPPLTITDYRAPSAIAQRALVTLSDLCGWIAQTADPDLPPAPHVSGRTLRDTARSLRALAVDLDTIADRLDPPHQAR